MNSSAIKAEGLSRDALHSKIRNSALGSLGMREHSIAELEKKLRQKFTDEPYVVEVLIWLQGLDYLNDGRFTEIFIRSSVGKGRGPVRIQQELQLRGVTSALISESLENSGVNWLELAAEVFERKFSEPALELKERAKQMRFLQRRGFGPDHIYPLFS